MNASTLDTRIGRFDPTALQVLDGTLAPLSDTGISSSDGLTTDNTPTLTGHAAPGQTVKIVAQRAGQMGLAPLGEAMADSTGRWSLTAPGPLPDAAYFLYAVVQSPPDGHLVAQPLLIGPSGILTIDTHGPQVVGAVANPQAGIVRLTVRDPISGVSPRGLSTTTAYSISQFGRPVGVSNITTSVEGTLGVIALTLDTTTPLRRGWLRLGVSPAYITDRAGNTLQGTFTGRFPTGDGRPLTAFRARFPILGRQMVKARSIPPRQRHLARAGFPPTLIAQG